MQSRSKSGRGEEFDYVTVGIAQEDLPRAIRALFFGSKTSARCFQVVCPLIYVIHLQGEMVSAIAGKHRVSAISDEVQFLARAESKPGAGKIERWAEEGFQLQHGLIEAAAFFHIRY